MEPMLRTAADYLNRIADEIDREAAGKTVFACDCCDHRNTMGNINESIVELSDSPDVELIGVNDKVTCPGCSSGIMSYRPDTQSEPFYEEGAAAPMITIIPAQTPAAPAIVPAGVPACDVPAPAAPVVPSLPPVQVEVEEEDDEDGDEEVEEAVDGVAKSTGIDMVKHASYLAY